MINKVTVTNHQDESLTMDLWNPYESGFAITGIDGVGPAKSTVNSTELSTADGSVYNSSRIESRDITITIKILDKPQRIEEGRHLLYKYFPQKKRIKLTFEADTRTCYIYGYVEENNAEYFSSLTAAQISIICPNPYFYWIENDVTQFSGIDPNFEFPFSNESLTENLLIMGIIRADTVRTILYTGEIDSGIIMTIHFIGTCRGDLTVYNNYSHDRIIIDLDKVASVSGATIGAGDDIIVNTIQGQKSVQLLRNGVYTNILNCINRDADWLQVTKGDNVFAYTVYDETADAETNALYLYAIQFTIENPVFFSGV